MKSPNEMTLEELKLEALRLQNNAIMRNPSKFAKELKGMPRYQEVLKLIENHKKPHPNTLRR